MAGILDSLITDRTQADVDRARYLISLWDAASREWKGTPEELAEYEAGLKGCYNAADLNRVESAAAYLAGLMLALPDELKAYAKELGVEWDEFYNVPYDLATLRLTTKTNWQMADIPRRAGSKRYLSNIIALCDGLQCGTEDLPESLDRLFYRDANAIERCLKEAAGAFDDLRDTLLRRLLLTAEAWPRAGEIYAGELI